MQTSPEPIPPDPPTWSHRPVLRQQWMELASFHWRYDPKAVQRLLPPGVAVDTFDGSAWVGLIPFEMRRVRLGSSPPVPWLGTFLEINVRTYVVDEIGRRAVWFFSLDVPRTAIVTVARAIFSLPYCWATATHDRSGDRHAYRMRRRWPRDGNPEAEMAFTVGSLIPTNDVTDLDHFLSARWALVTQRGSKLLYGRVHHPRWALHHVRDVSIRQDVIETAGLPSPEGPPHAFYSPGVDVEVAWFSHIRAPEGSTERTS